MATSITQPVSTLVTVTTPLFDVCPLFCQVPSTATVSWLTLTGLPTSCSPAPALALATVRSGQTRSEKLTVFWLFSVLPVSPWLANSPTFGRVPVSVVSGTSAASLPNETTET
ncbi:hypothetical protein J6590_034948 [Homalodisca vitripennis]|nr:hypothetical protein J6590_034948 [Homalodisca vitripennis]